VATEIAQEMARIEKGEEPAFVGKYRNTFEVDWKGVLEDLSPTDPYNALWQDRVERDNPPVPNELTVKAQVERYLSLERDRIGRGLSVSEYDTTHRCLHAFLDWIGGDSSVASINADRWEAYWSHLLKGKESIEYKKKKLRLAKCFVEWMVSKAIIPLPPNLHNRRYRFGGGVKAVSTITVEEVRRLIERSS